MIGKPAYVMFIFILSLAPNAKTNQDIQQSRMRSCVQFQTMEKPQMAGTRVAINDNCDFVHFFPLNCLKTSSAIELIHLHAISSKLGGPLLRRSDNTFIGVISFLRYKRWHLFCIRPVKLQGFTKVHYHFDWISQITGLELPKC